MTLHFFVDNVKLTGKMIITISSLQGSASRRHADLLAKFGDERNVFEALPGKLDIKRHSLSILYTPWVTNLTFVIEISVNPRAAWISDSWLF